ncbi:MAG TPA: copper chaperone PCu(A)C [Hyphomicrobiaceae bacterium]
MTVMRVLIAGILLPLMGSLAFAQGSSDGIAVSEAWLRATPGGVKTGAAYLTISDTGPGDRLVAAKSDVAERVELHNHVHENGVMKMRRVDAIEIPAGETVTLAPGGYHLMLFDLKHPLKAGEKVQLTLEFEKAGEIPVTASVEPIGAKGPSGAVAGDHHHSEAGHKH